MRTMAERMTDAVSNARTRQQYLAAVSIRERLVERYGPMVSVADRTRYGLAAQPSDPMPNYRRCYEPTDPAAASAPDSGDLGVRYSARGDDGGLVPTATAVLDGATLWAPDPARRDLAALRRSIRRRSTLAADDPATFDDAVSVAWLEMAGLRDRYLTPRVGEPYGRDRHGELRERPAYLTPRSVYAYAASRALRGLARHGGQVRNRLPVREASGGIGQPWTRVSDVRVIDPDRGSEDLAANVYRYESTDRDGRPVAVTVRSERPYRYVSRAVPVAMGPTMGDPVSAALAAASGDLATVLRVADAMASGDRQAARKGVTVAVGRYLATGSVTRATGESEGQRKAYARAGARVVDGARTQWEAITADAEARCEAMVESVTLADL